MRNPNAMNTVPLPTPAPLLSRSGWTAYIAALGLGLLNKLLEGWTGAVLAKIAVLIFIIVFIQKRPQGIFAMKGRNAEA